MKKYIALFILIALVLGACSVTQLTTWKDPAYQGEKFQKIAVIGLFKDLEARKIIENNLVARFQEEGIQSLASLDVLAPSKNDYTHQELEEIFSAQHVDGVLIMKIISVDKDQTYVPPTYYYDCYYGYFPAMMQDGGYYQTTTTVKIESSLFSNATDKLVWTGQSKTVDPNNVNNLATSLSKKIVDNLEQEGLIPEVEKKN